jgi:hypothetical protein
MHMLTVLEIARKVSLRLGQGAPSALVGSADETAAQLREFIEQAGKFCFNKQQWSVGVRSTSFLTTATEEQGLIETLIPDLNYLTCDRMFYLGDNATEIPFQVYNGRIWIKPAPAEGEEVTLFYQTRSWLIQDESDATALEFITSDSNLVVLDPELMILAVKAVWKLENGLPAEADLAARNQRLSELAMRDGFPQVLDMVPKDRVISPSVTIAAYNTIPT